MTLGRLTTTGIALALPFTLAACADQGHDSARESDSEMSVVTSAPATSVTEENEVPEYSLVSPDSFMDDSGDNANVTLTIGGNRILLRTRRGGCRLFGEPGRVSAESRRHAGQSLGPVHRTAERDFRE